MTRSSMTQLCALDFLPVKYDLGEMEKKLNPGLRAGDPLVIVARFVGDTALLGLAFSSNNSSMLPSASDSLGSMDMEVLYARGGTVCL